MICPIGQTNPETLAVYRYSINNNFYTGIFDFQWIETSGQPNGYRIAVQALQVDVGDYTTLETPFGVLALRIDDELRYHAELRVGGRTYELPIKDGDTCECACAGCETADHCDRASCAQTA